MLTTEQTIADQLAALYHRVNDTQRNATPADYKSTMLPLLSAAWNAAKEHNYATVRTRVDEAATFSKAYRYTGGERSTFGAELSLINFELGDLQVPLSDPAHYIHKGHGSREMVS